MDSKLYLTISAIVLILYGIGFTLMPADVGALYGVPPEPHVLMADRFFGSTLLAVGVITG